MTHIALSIMVGLVALALMASALVTVSTDAALVQFLIALGFAGWSLVLLRRGLVA